MIQQLLIYVLHLIVSSNNRVAVECNLNVTSFAVLFISPLSSASHQRLARGKWKFPVIRGAPLGLLPPPKFPAFNSTCLLLLLLTHVESSPPSRQRSSVA